MPEADSARAESRSEVKYSEVRRWARTLEVFTASDLAEVLRVSHALAERMVDALLYHDICRRTIDIVQGQDGPEYIVAYVPIPYRRINREKRTPPEIAAAKEFGMIFVTRGLPIRLRSDRQMRTVLSTPGNRQRHKLRELRYERQQNARSERAEKDRRKAQKEPKWKRRK